MTRVCLAELATTLNDRIRDDKSWTIIAITLARAGRFAMAHRVVLFRISKGAQKNRHRVIAGMAAARKNDVEGALAIAGTISDRDIRMIIAVELSRMGHMAAATGFLTSKGVKNAQGKIRFHLLMELAATKPADVEPALKKMIAEWDGKYDEGFQHFNRIGKRLPAAARVRLYPRMHALLGKTGHDFGWVGQNWARELAARGKRQEALVILKSYVTVWFGTKQSPREPAGARKPDANTVISLAEQLAWLGEHDAIRYLYQRSPRGNRFSWIQVFARLGDIEQVMRLLPSKEKALQRAHSLALAINALRGRGKPEATARLEKAFRAIAGPIGKDRRLGLAWTMVLADTQAQKQLFANAKALRGRDYVFAYLALHHGSRRNYQKLHRLLDKKGLGGMRAHIVDWAFRLHPCEAARDTALAGKLELSRAIARDWYKARMYLITSPVEEKTTYEMVVCQIMGNDLIGAHRQIFDANVPGKSRLKALVTLIKRTPGK